MYHADYRLMSKRALDGLSQFKEVNLFLRGIVPLIGYRYSVVEYERHERFAGESKYPLKKMLAFAWDGITSFSIKPIRIITGLGFSIFVLSFIALIYSLIVKFMGNTEAGWTSITISIWMIGGIQLLSLGVIGEYIGKIYNETKQRPRFIIADKLIKEVFFSKQFIMFVFIGVINTFNGVIFSYIYSSFLNENVAFIFGYISGLVISYILNSYVTFKEKLEFNKFIKFAVSYIPNFIIQNIVVFIVFNMMGLHKLIAYGLAAVIGVPITFVFMKFFAFKNTSKKILKIQTS